MPDLNQQIENIVNKRINYIDKSLGASWTEMETIQKELTLLILKSYVNKFDIEDGVLKFNTKNLNLINELDSIFDVFAKRYSNKIFKDVGQKMLDMAVFSEEYFAKFGAKESTFRSIAGKLDVIAKRVGVTPEGTLIKNSYLDRLATAPQFKEQLKDYVAKGLAEKTSLRDFQKGFGDLIEGSKEVDSNLLKYWKTETHDSFFAVSRSNDDIFAQALGMEFFVYLPGSIKTSRPFCKGGHDVNLKKGIDIKFEPKVGQCFHRLDAEKWRNIEWTGKKHPYNPIADMGGWNCRHTASWISNGMVKRKYPEKYNEYKAILKNPV